MANEKNSDTLKVPLMVGVGVALVGFVILQLNVSQRIAKIRRDSKTETICALVAEDSVEAADTFEREDFGWREVARNDMPVGTILFENPASGKEAKQLYDDKLTMLTGLTAARPVKEGQVLHEIDFNTAGEESLAEIIKPGKRAFPINVSNADLLSGLLQPNDYVDVVAKYEANSMIVTAEEVRSVGRHPRTEVILQNVPVVSVGGRLARAVYNDWHGGSSTVILEVTPDQALALSHIAGAADLSVLLRSDEEGGTKAYGVTQINIDNVSKILKTIKQTE